jgi:hypothetical protein
VSDALYTAGGSAAGAAAGGLVGQNVSGSPAAPIIGAASGAAIGGIGTILAINSAKAGQRKQFQQGYDQGASDTVKRQYWVLQNLQKEKEDPAYRLTYYRFTIPPDPDGSQCETLSQVGASLVPSRVRSPHKFPPINTLFGSVGSTASARSYQD